MPAGVEDLDDVRADEGLAADARPLSEVAAFVASDPRVVQG